MSQVDVNEKPDHVHVTFSGELTIYNVSEIFNQKLLAINLDKDLHIELADVLEVDTAGIQLILELVAQCHKSGHSSQLMSTSPVIDDYCQLFNLTDFILQKDLGE